LHEIDVVSVGAGAAALAADHVDPASAPQARVGISGFSYPPWRGIFYPPGLRQADELAYASRKFSTIEINGAFYSLQRPESYATWRRCSPPGFVFAVKGGRFITHMKRLRDVKAPLANFFASGLLCLGEKLGPILWQLPPTFALDLGRLRAFFELLPKDIRELQQLARQHDRRLRGRVALEAITDNRRLCHALEVRHESFRDARYFDLLREHGIASCVADSAGVYPELDEVTTDFSYFRLHGGRQLYVSGYGPRALEKWAARISRLGPRDVYVYFDNDVKVRAPFDAQNLARVLVGQRPLRLPRSLVSVSEQPRSSWRGSRPSRRAPT
ncbi:MAG TPA: DUF72 domain-containing protein, partial [Polyangiaceae bacterium]|nr:DUF72 domain-containing protein [Polyangiaceae bacterium]